MDQYQRSYEVLHHNEVAKSGVDRGLTFYFHKCWTCHTAAAAGDESGLVGPLLNDVSKRMSDQALAAKIKNGGPRMHGGWQKSPTLRLSFEQPIRSANI